MLLEAALHLIGVIRDLPPFKARSKAFLKRRYFVGRPIAADFELFLDFQINDLPLVIIG